jgi:hypothetical protein
MYLHAPSEVWCFDQHCKKEKNLSRTWVLLINLGGLEYPIWKLCTFNFWQEKSADDLMPKAQKFIYRNGNSSPPTAVELDKSLLRDLFFNASPAKVLQLLSTLLHFLPAKLQTNAKLKICLVAHAQSSWSANCGNLESKV